MSGETAASQMWGQGGAALSGGLLIKSWFGAEQALIEFIACARTTSQHFARLSDKGALGSEPLPARAAPGTRGDPGAGTRRRRSRACPCWRVQTVSTHAHRGDIDKHSKHAAC